MYVCIGMYSFSCCLFEFENEYEDALDFRPSGRYDERMSMRWSCMVSLLFHIFTRKDFFFWVETLRNFLLSPLLAHLVRKINALFVGQNQIILLSIFFVP